MVIVGAGPAGTSAALFAIAQQPALRHRMLVIDKAQFPREKICAGAIGARADRALAGIGIHINVASAPIRGLAARTGYGTLCERSPKIIGRVVRRHDFDNALLEQARLRGIHVREGVRLRHIQQNEQGFVLETNVGKLHCRAIIGADGVGSTVRRKLGLKRGHWHAQAIECDTPWHRSDAKNDILSFDLSDRSYRGYSWDFPTICGNRSMVCRGIYRLTKTPAETALPGPDIAKLLAQRLQALGFDPAAFRFKRFAERGLARHAPYGGSGAMLIGEAAGIDPALGEGIPQAILYGACAGPYLAKKWARGKYSYADFGVHLRSTRLGLDLRLRQRATPLLYGNQRAFIENWLNASPALAQAGMAYFAGERVPRKKLLTALADAGSSTLAHLWRNRR